MSKRFTWGMGSPHDGSCSDGSPAPPALTTRASPPIESDTLLVTNKFGGVLSVHELPAGRVLATLPAGPGPHELAISPDGTRAVVSAYGEQTAHGRTVTVIDMVACTIVRRIELGDYDRPNGIAFLDDHRVIVTAEGNASVAIVDLVEPFVFVAKLGVSSIVLVN